jgi:hypothetical protein
METVSGLIAQGAFYAGIGSRKTPPDILGVMRRMAAILERDGMILRSGGAPGADAAFEEGVSDPANKVICLPWKGFSDRWDELSTVHSYSEEHARIAEETHPAWWRCGRGAKALHIRNVAQVLGGDCRTPSRFVLCWTPTGTAQGGTGQAIRIAWKHKVPVINLQTQSGFEAAERYLDTGELTYER